MRPSGIEMLVALSATWILVKSVLAGLACLSDPCYNGICMDDLNSTYSCYCIDGYTGIQCQTNWDECWSAPCQNGGACIDGIASFNCSCPDGFIGDTCEVNYNECESNPCQNNGTCMDQDNGYICACLPGYTGKHCEVDVAVCNATGEERCENGGICIEGPGLAFKCQCAEGWKGNLCQLEIDECQSSPCQNGAICIDLQADYACACTFGYTGKNCEEEIVMCDHNPCKNDAICVMEEDTPVCYCVPDYHGEKCQFQYDECQLGPRCMNGGTCIDGIDNFTCSCPVDLTGTLCECLIINSTEVDCTYIRPTDFTYATESTLGYTISSTTFLPPSEGTSQSTEIYVPKSTTPYQENITYTTSDFYSSSMYATFSSTRELRPETTTDLMTMDLSTTLESTEVMTTYASSFATSEKSFTESSEGREISGEPTGITTEISTIFSLPHSTEETTITETTSDFGQTLPFNISSSTIIPTSSPEMSITEVTSESSSVSVTYSINISSTMTEVISTTGVTYFTEEPTTDAYSRVSLMTTEISDIDISTAAQLPDCAETPCVNGGVCVLTFHGHKCVCPFDAEGPLCEILLGIRHAAFNGNSYLTHRLTQAPGLTVKFKAKTLSSNGILFYANYENTYMILYVHNGLLKFQFSCGFQTMLLSELEVPVNSGYDLVIEAKQAFSKDLKHCNASLSVNNTLTMSGNQVAFVEHFTRSRSWLHLGNVPQKYVQKYVTSIPGFTGCIENLMVNDKFRNIFKDAEDGMEIRECSSLACLSNPCRNGATCTEINEQWNCHCRNGFIGNMCQKSVCENNPCQFGATCVPYIGSGYLCLCPFGKRGHFCENDLEISEPMFSSSVHGMSSFAAYQIPTAISHNVEISFKFRPDTIDQISLVMFVGQAGVHDFTSDHMAVSFVKGYIMLTWNLGSGPRRIFTNKPIDNSDLVDHIVRLGRIGRRAWLKVDDLVNVTGRSPGKLVHLDVLPLLYLGGHDSSNFSILPHDLPLHSGFSGCIYDVEIKSGSIRLPLQGFRLGIGRSLGQCGFVECHEQSCQNGGVCMQHGPTFTCICQDGWFGPFCSLRSNPCDSDHHNCTSGSTCVPLVAGYECDCSIGKTGRFCEKDEELTDVTLSGERSYIMLPSIEFDNYKFIVEFEIRPLGDRGIILFIGRLDSSVFLSVSIQGLSMEVRVSTGKYDFEHILIVRSGRMLAVGVWHNIRVGVLGRKILLSVDGVVNSGILKVGEVLPLVGSPLYIGGLPDLSNLPFFSTPSPTPYKGCIRQLHLNSRPLPLNHDTISSSRNVADCDGTPCGGDFCSNGGTCWLDPRLRPRCACADSFSGPRCQVRASCTERACEHGACDGSECACTIGWGGAYCETEIRVRTPQFRGNGYVVVKKKDAGDKKRDVRGMKELGYLRVNFTTVVPDGLMVWSAKGKAFIGIGMERSYLKVAWALADGSTFVQVIKGQEQISDGLPHELAISLEPANITILVDNNTVYNEPHFNLTKKYNPETNGIFFIGGFPKNVSIFKETFGYFKTNFIGCINSLSFEKSLEVNDFSNYEGANIDDCESF